MRDEGVQIERATIVPPDLLQHFCRVGKWRRPNRRAKSLRPPKNGPIELPDPPGSATAWAQSQSRTCSNLRGIVKHEEKCVQPAFFSKKIGLLIAFLTLISLFREEWARRVDSGLRLAGFAGVGGTCSHGAWSEQLQPSYEFRFIAVLLRCACGALPTHVLSD